MGKQESFVYDQNTFPAVDDGGNMPTGGGQDHDVIFYPEAHFGAQPSVSENCVSQQIRTTVISSDSVEQRGLKNRLGQNPLSSSHSPPSTMNRMNWLTYLKILFDQLEKHKEPAVNDNASAQST
jgi:hypothetical protein